jgi:HEPN domain-containing protein
MTLNDQKIADLIEYWMQGADEDLESAESIFIATGKVGPALFYLHLSLEKALKACFVKKFKEHAPYTHNLTVLVERLGWEPDENLIEDLGEINQFNTSGRYPDQKLKLRQKFSREYATIYIGKGKELYKWILSRSQEL